jgi:tetratricopeptide (TPR) repeat protein
MAKREEAIAYFQRKIQENAMDPEPHCQLAVLYRSMGDHEGHARHVRIATLTKDGGPKVWHEMGLALLEQGKVHNAQLQFEQVIQYWPSFPWAYVNMSVITARHGEYAEALAFALKALEYVQDDPALHRNAAKIYEAMGKTAEALAHYQRAHLLAPEDAEVAKRIALLSLLKKNTEEAALHYEKYRHLTGQHYDLKL